MAKPFLTPESKAALAQAARGVEACSSAELVVAVRPRTGSYLHADLLAGIVAGIAVDHRSCWSPNGRSRRSGSWSIRS